MAELAESRVARWERQAEVPMALLALAFLVGWAWQVLDPDLPHSWQAAVTVTSWTVWAAFALDFVARLVLAERRGSYALRHWYDVVLIALPVFRPLRLLRLVAFSRIINRSAVGNLAGRVVVYVCGAAVSSVFLASLAVLQAERDAPDGNIKRFGDALWWSWCTATTVGYGDRYPVTTTGRLIAVALMVVGIALVGAFTAAIAAYILAAVQAEHARTAHHLGLHWPLHPPGPPVTPAGGDQTPDDMSGPVSDPG